ncbi:MAG TPA: histidine phosphatase family protein [Streptosporangiaceae bacterium]|nr:histidine phosphatase family protein [Streptosporangiaceae bacterium]
MTRFLYLIRHGDASPHDGPLSAIGREQAQLAGTRLRPVPLTSICHGPLPRVAQTAAIIAANFPAVPVTVDELAGDYVPPVGDAGPPAPYVGFLANFTPAERVRGSELARAALGRFARAAPEAGDTHELVVTHNFLIGWLVSQALAGPAWRWLGVNQMNAALTVIAYSGTLPPRLLSFNDAAHLPVRLRWTGFPATVTPPSI